MFMEAGKLVLAKNPRKTAISHKLMRRLKDMDRIPDCSVRPFYYILNAVYKSADLQAPTYPHLMLRCWGMQAR